MNPHRSLATVLLFAALTLPGAASAQTLDMTGSWEFTGESPNGDGQREVTLVQVGDSLSGTISSSRADGSLSGTVVDGEVVMEAAVSMGSGVFILVYEGVVTETEGGMEISGTVDFGDYGQGSFRGRKLPSTDGGVPPEGRPAMAPPEHAPLRGVVIR